MVDGARARRRSRGLLAAVAVVGGMASLAAGPATAHVHGITPLRCVGVADDGANRTDTTPAAAVNGGPIFGLIPSSVGKAPLTAQVDGGFDTPACPVIP
jgi:hypothetical protein